MYYGADEGDDAKMEENSAGTIAIEAASNIRTGEAGFWKICHLLASLVNTNSFIVLFIVLLRWTHSSHFLLSLAIDYVVSMFGLMFLLYGLSIAAEGAVDGDKAKEVAKHIFTLADRHSKIDPLSDSGKNG